MKVTNYIDYLDALNSDRSPKRKQRSNRYIKRKVQDIRIAEDKRKYRDEIPFLTALTLDSDETKKKEINDVVANEEENKDNDMYF
ncbi:hypothetical protein PTT_11105 [Pyrenophora teres f. teres 0-1]|uniref:Uncharacterized protein n=1 Tax=Pyrenophora teres f. teres (strain 0-1) TaxID=861557 RepID=E3RQS4_PYRTT|nr:hypothetical protein PTT_11105 [Pyrenophora teres f. teres 0-1]